MLAALRQITAALSVALILVGALVSSHAMAAHVSGLANAPAAPCQHAMDSGQDGAAAPGAFDFCRQLCLNKIPDSAITAVSVQPMPTEPAVAPFVALTSVAVTSVPLHAHATMSAPPDHRPRPAVDPATTRLLI